MSDLEVQLLETLIKIRVRFLDGAKRIQNCLSLFEKAEIEMGNDPKLRDVWKTFQNNSKAS